AWWPGKVKAGAETSHVASFADWLGTAADLAETKAPANVDSISFAPTLLGQEGQAKHEFLYWEFHENGFKQAALYQGRWKGIRQGRPDAPVALYDQENDVAEEKNVAKEHPEIVEKIGAYLKTARTDLADWEPRWQSAKKKK
ncbi:MAG: N-acetylgalactosamine 6-sulfate sulfatase, partial [Prosthecobacter sp.]|nr:N-acetylgalactosamine 6-sulfate sulfatase [Prosthecobacter sp.]